MVYRLLTGLLLLFWMVACIPPRNEVEEEPVTLDLTDQTTRHIFDLQNERRQDSLLLYLDSERPTYRYLAARALASFPSLSDIVVDSLIGYLRDPDVSVRTQVAHTLGQTRQPQLANRLIEAFNRTGHYPTFDAAILEAAGKTGDLGVASDLAGITTYTPADTQLMTGRAWGLYYAALNGYRNAQTDRAMVDLLLRPGIANRIKRPAAYYLQRIDFRVDTAQEHRLRDQLRNTIDPILAMGIIRTLGRSGMPSSRVALLRRMESSQDWRERVEIIHALTGFDYATVRESVVEALRDPHPLVALAAANYFVENGKEVDAPLYLQLARDELPKTISPQLYRAANRHLSPFLTDYRQRINRAVQQAYAATDNVYTQADLLRSLGEFPWNYRILYRYYREATEPPARTAAAEALQQLSDRDDFDDYFRGNARRVRAELAGYWQEMIESTEEGPAYHAAQALSSNAATYRDYYDQLHWLPTALEQYELPRQLETYREVFAADNALRDRALPLPNTDNPQVHQIDWDLLDRNANKTVTITTAEGPIKITLYPELAPATVSSFLTLVGRGYYDGKVFHRVVPNFVAQGGGPRGDGFGSEDFTVRTETPGVHWDRAGLVGMASAGKDTEGVQFFITHRPTPHLDDNYTIFGAVTEGQEVVDRLVPGSRILSISTD